MIKTSMTKRKIINKKKMKIISEMKMQTHWTLFMFLIVLCYESFRSIVFVINVRWPSTSQKKKHKTDVCFIDFGCPMYCQYSSLKPHFCDL